MTATTVDGRKVITEEAALSPIRRRDGSNIAFSRIRRLLLDDGSTIHGCLQCDYTAAGVGSVRAHLRVHRPVETPAGKPGPKPRPDASLNGVGDLTIRELLAMGQRAAGTAEALDRMTDDRNKWKSEATALKRDLTTIRRALGVQP